MNLKDLQKIRDEFESINKIYRKTFSLQARLDLIERVKKLITAIQSLKERT